MVKTPRRRRKDPRFWDLVEGHEGIWLGERPNGDNSVNTIWREYGAFKKEQIMYNEQQGSVVEFPKNKILDDKNQRRGIMVRIFDRNGKSPFVDMLNADLVKENTRLRQVVRKQESTINGVRKAAEKAGIDPNRIISGSVEMMKEFSEVKTRRPDLLEPKEEEEL